MIVIKFSNDISILYILRGNYLLKSYILVLVNKVSNDLLYISKVEQAKIMLSYY